MEAPTNQPQSGDLLKTVIKVMEGPKTLTIRKIGGGGHAVLWGERGFKLFPSLPLFLSSIFTSLHVPWPDPSPAPSSSLSNQVTYIRSIFSLISDNVEPSRRRTHSSNEPPRRLAASSRVMERDSGERGGGGWTCRGGGCRSIHGLKMRPAELKRGAVDRRWLWTRTSERVCVS